MKRVLAFLLAISMVFLFTACGGGSSDDVLDDDSQDVTEETDSSVPDRELAEGSYEEVGDGLFYISGDSRSTKDGEAVFLSPDTSADPYTYLDYELSKVDGSFQTFIYIDGIEMDDTQAEEHKSSIGLAEDELWALTEGEHKVEAVQYADNDPEGKMVFYRSATYTVNAK